MIEFSALKETIRDRTDLVALVAEHVALRAQGQRMVGLCPFHQEKTPSFSVSPSKQMFKCFGCGVGGDVFTFVQLRERVDFREALRILAEKAGIDGDRFVGRAGGGGVDRADLAKVNAWAAALFAGAYADPAMGRVAREYAASRSISPAMVERFSLGFAPDNGSWIMRRGREAGIGEARLKAAGLIRVGERGDAYGVFRGRLMFPIRDTMNRVIGFGGRTLQGDKAKYLNTSQNVLFDKGRNLFGIDMAREAMRGSRRSVVVEGYTDCIAAHQFGFGEAVATLGTALTQEQVLLLKRWSDELILVFDSDAAGEEAADRALGVALRNNLSVRIAQVTSGKDPSDFLHAEGADAFAALLNSAEDALGFKWNRTCARFASAGGAGRKEAVREFVNLVAHLTRFGQVDAIQRGLIVNQLSALLALPGEEVHQLLRTTRVVPARVVPAPTITAGFSSSARSGAGAAGGPSAGALVSGGKVGCDDNELLGGEGFAEAADAVTWDAEQGALLSILRVLVNAPGYYREVAQVFRPERFRQRDLRHIAAQVVTLCDAEGEYPLRTLLGRFEEPAQAQLLADLVYEGEQIGNFAATVADTRERLERLAALRKGRQAAHELRAAAPRADRSAGHAAEAGTAGGGTAEAGIAEAGTVKGGIASRGSGGVVEVDDEVVEVDDEAERLRRIQRALSGSRGFAPGVPMRLDQRDAGNERE